MSSRNLYEINTRCTAEKCLLKTGLYEDAYIYCYVIHLNNSYKIFEDESAHET
jgi:hypothetical protein